MPDWLTNSATLGGAGVLLVAVLVKLWPVITRAIAESKGGRLNPRHIAVSAIIALIAGVGKDQRVIDILDETVQKLSELDDPQPAPAPLPTPLTAAQLQAAAELLARAVAVKPAAVGG